MRPSCLLPGRVDKALALRVLSLPRGTIMDRGHLLRDIPDHVTRLVWGSPLHMSDIGL